MRIMKTLKRLPRGHCALIYCLVIWLCGAAPAYAQWPALYFRADPFLRMDLARPEGGSTFGLAVYSYTAESYFDGQDQTPHTSKQAVPTVRFQREDYVFSGAIGLSQKTAIVLSLPVSHVRQRLFETGDWGVEKVWVGATRAFGRGHHLTMLMAAAIPIDGAVGNLHSPVAARDHSGFLTAQIVLRTDARPLVPRLYLRVGSGLYLEKEEYYGRRLYEFPGEFRATYPIGKAVQFGLGSEGRFVVGAPDDRFFAPTLSSHDAFAFGPDLMVSLTPQASLHVTYRHEAIGFFATAGSYWNVSMAVFPGRP